MLIDSTFFVRAKLTVCDRDDMQLGPAAHRMLAEMVADMLVSRDMLNFGGGKQNATAAANQTLAQPPTKPAPGLR